MFANTKEKGQALAMPDVCKTPAPPSPSPIPVPYPNMADFPLAQKAARKVFIHGMPALTKASTVEPTQGDQPGVAGGLSSGKIMGKAAFTQGSVCVKIEGSPAQRLGDPTTQNDNNAVGTCVQPSQTVVMINS